VKVENNGAGAYLSTQAYVHTQQGMTNTFWEADTQRRRAAVDERRKRRDDPREERQRQSEAQRNRGRGQVMQTVDTMQWQLPSINSVYG